MYKITEDVLQLLIKNIDDIDLINKILRCDKYIIINITHLFTEEINDIYETSGISKKDIEFYLRKGIECGHDEIREVLMLLSNGFYIINSDKEEIISQLNKIFVPKHYEEQKKNIKNRKLFTDDDYQEEKLSSGIDMGKLLEVKKFYGDIYSKRLVKSKLDFIDAINNRDDISLKYKIKIANRVNEVYNYDIISSLIDIYRNDKLMNGMEDIDVYRVIKAICVNDSFLSKRFCKVLNDQLVLQTRSFDDIKQILEVIYNDNQADKMLPEYILLNEYVLKNRTLQQSLILNDFIIKSKSTDDARILKELMVAPTIESITFPEQIDMLRLANKCEKIENKKNIVFFFNQTLYNDNLNQDMRMKVAQKILNIKEESLSEEFTNFAVKICRCNNLEEDDIKRFIDQIDDDDNTIDMEVKNIVLDSVHSIYASKEELYEYFRIMNKSENNVSQDIREALKLLDISNKIKTAKDISELRKSTEKTK